MHVILIAADYSTCVPKGVPCQVMILQGAKQEAHFSMRTRCSIAMLKYVLVT